MTREHNRQLIFAAALTFLFCAGGVVMIVLGWRSYADNRAFVTGAEAAKGKVVGFETYDAPGARLGDDIHCAIVLYTTEDGREVRFEGPSKDSLVKLGQGDDVRVLYYPDAPEEARVDCFMGLWFPATMLWIVGGGAVAIPLLTLRQAWKWVKRQSVPAGGG